VRIRLRLFPGPDRRQSAALVGLGFLAGLAVGVVLLAGHLDRLSLERDQLLVKAADLEVRVERLRERLDHALTGGPGPIVREVTLHLEGLDDVTRLHVHVQAAKLVEDLIGKSVSEIDSALAYHLLDGRTVSVDGQTVRLTVRAVVLGPEAAYWLDLEVRPDHGDEPGP
jgi:hypothetical protein